MGITKAPRPLAWRYGTPCPMRPRTPLNNADRRAVWEEAQLGPFLVSG